jgi:hypothetical protein
MSIKISLLKKSKQIVIDWLEENYEGEYSVFYSTGTKAKEFADQFLKIKLDCFERKFPLFASKIRNELLKTDESYSELKFKIFSLTN